MSGPFGLPEAIGVPEAIGAIGAIGASQSMIDLRTIGTPTFAILAATKQPSAIATRPFHAHK
jgi:hypothetical protein